MITSPAIQQVLATAANALQTGNLMGAEIALAPFFSGQLPANPVGSSRVDLQACKLEYSIVSPK